MTETKPDLEFIKKICQVLNSPDNRRFPHLAAEEQISQPVAPIVLLKASGGCLQQWITNLLDVLHRHVDLVHLLVSNRDLDHVDDVGMFQRAKDGDFAQRRDRDSVLALVGQDADLLQGDDCRACRVSCSIDDAIGCDGRVSVDKREKRVRFSDCLLPSPS